MICGMQLFSPLVSEAAPPLDLNELVVEHPAATFFVRVEGDGFETIQSGDILVVDRSLTPRVGSLVIAVVDDAFELTRVKSKEIYVWGVVSYVVHCTH